MPKEMTLKFAFSLMPASYSILQNFARIIRIYRLPDSNKGADVLYDNEIVICKQGKK